MPPPTVAMFKYPSKIDQQSRGHNSLIICRITVRLGYLSFKYQSDKLKENFWSKFPTTGSLRTHHLQLPTGDCENVWETSLWKLYLWTY